MTQNPNCKSLCDNEGKELIMVRTDIALHEMMAAQPVSRWDPEYWHPKWDFVEGEMRKPRVKLSQYIPEDGITYGQVGSRVFSKKGVIRYLQVINVRSTGIDFDIKDDRLEEGSNNDLERSRLESGQLLLTNTTFPGMDTLIGRTIVVPSNIGKANVSQDIDVIDIVDIEPEVVCSFLKTKFGQAQIHRRMKGVKSIKINFEDIRAIEMPVFSTSERNLLIGLYKQMESTHLSAMQSKKEKDSLLKQAQNELDKLILQCEEIIRSSSHS